MPLMSGSGKKGQVMNIRVVMSSEEFGAEDFDYDSVKEAYEGIIRICQEAINLSDRVLRSFEMTVHSPGL